MPVTTADIARVAGVSETTVIRALRDTGRISPGTRARVKRIAAKLNYRPNQIARSLALGKSRLVGMMVSHSMIIVLQSVMKPIQASLRKAGYPVLFFVSGDNPWDERFCTEQLIQHRVCGVVLCPGPSPADPEVYRELIRSGTRVVVIERYIEDIPATQIIYDDHGVAQLATKYLTSLGHRRIVHMGVPLNSYAGRERDRGFRDAMIQAGIPVDASSTVETDPGDESGAAVMARLLRRRNRPTAVVVRNDVNAAGAMRAVFNAGLSVPRDVSIIGCGDLWCGDILRVPLTTVHIPFEKMALRGVECLLNELSEKDAGLRVEKVDHELVIRSSCAPPDLLYS